MEWRIIHLGYRAGGSSKVWTAVTAMNVSGIYWGRWGTVGQNSDLFGPVILQRATAKITGGYVPIPLCTSGHLRVGRGGCTLCGLTGSTLESNALQAIGPNYRTIAGFWNALVALTRQRGPGESAVSPVAPSGVSFLAGTRRVRL